MRRTSAVLAAAAVAVLAFAPSFADARAGSGASMGSRGGRTYSAPPSTSTAPFSTAPMERSTTVRPSPYNTPAAPYAGGGSGFASGLMGGLLGFGLGSLIFGHGYSGGGFGFIGTLLQLVLLFFIGRWVFRRFFGGAVSYAGMPRMGQPAAPAPVFGGGGRPAAPPVAIGPEDYQAFDRTLQEVQAAWSAQDVPRLQQLVTPEMVGYFSEQLAGQASRGVRNTVTDVRLDKGDLSEAWAEDGRTFATVAMRFSMIDVTRDPSGRVVDGSPTERVTATEVWTFMRAQGGRWLLSAIQQAR